jgi:hypothetical protein
MTLVDRSVDACLAAIEIYNKPDFRYREEAFSILMLNAWELLLKARVIKENNDKPRSIEVWEPALKKDGTKSKRFRPKLNRSKNTMTIDIGRAIGLVQSYAADNIDTACVENLSLLMEIRDNCVHLAVVRPGLGKRIQEVGSASLRNFVYAAQRWFTVNLERFNFFLMPLAFQSPAEVVADLMREQPPATKNLLNYIAEVEAQHPSDAGREFNVTMGIEVRFVRSPDPQAIPVKVGKDGVQIQLSEPDIRARWPWRYQTLTKKLRERYSDFGVTAKYHKIRKSLEDDLRFCHVRLVDPDQPDAGGRKFYSPNVLAEFDKHYTLRAAAAAPTPAAAAPATPV